MTGTIRKPRPRRIAADEAHAWARNLRVRNSLAKLVLSMLTLYVNGEGTCYVSVPQLAEDCEVSANTIRSRLAYLEEIGAIARFRQWVDDAGRRNSEGRGRQTSDEIRLLIEADIDEIEARAVGRRTAEGHGVDPSRREGSDEDEAAFDPARAEGSADPKNLPQDSISPSATLHLRGGPESFEPEPEDSPQAPQGGAGGSDLKNQEEGQTELEGWQEFKTAFEADGNPIMRVSIAKTLFAALTPEQRQRAEPAAKGLIAQRASQKKPGAKPSAQTFLRETDAWEAFIKFAPAANGKTEPSPLRFIPENSAEFRAWQIASLVAGNEIVMARDCGEHGSGLLVRSPERPRDFLSLGAPSIFDLSTWVELDVIRDREAVGAWKRRFEKWGLKPIDIKRVSTDEIFATSPSGMNLYRKREIVEVPRYYPPRADGTWPEIEHPPPLSKPLAIEQDLEEFARTG